jgi:hypothetical protein
MIIRYAGFRGGRPSTFSAALSAVFISAAASVSPASGQAAPALTPIPLIADRWTATDSILFESHLGRPSMYINRGVALANGIELRDGVIEFEMAATPQSSFLGVSFHAAAHDNAEIIFFRVGQSGTTQAVQYGPALNSLGAAWQVFSGAGANARAELQRERWIHVRVELAAGSATLFLDRQQEPVLTVPRLAGTSGNGLGVWTGLFGRGAYYSNFAYSARPPSAVATAATPDGMLDNWELSQVLDAETLAPGTLPDLSRMNWEPATLEAGGFVLINRYRVAPVATIPFDAQTRVIDVDSVMGGRVAGTKVVLARTHIDADFDGYRRMHFGYSDGIIVYANSQPLFFGMNAQFFRGDGIMSSAGDAVYLPLRRGRNEIVLAITEYSGGWAFWAKLDEPTAGAGT